ncbi:MAG TPA: TolC family protein [Gemmataceae bacterium]|nr:TolC family protein [Gemmataceae bacterium]
MAVAADMPVRLLSRRPDVRGAERLIAAQSPQIGVATADLYPSISISTVLGELGFNGTPLPSQNGGLAVVTPTFSWNLLNYGRLVSNVHLQEAKTQELVAAFQGKVLTAAQEVQTSLRAFLRSQEQAEAAAKSAEAAAQAAKIGEKLFGEVKADVNRLFLLESSKLQQQDNLAVAQGNIALNLISVYRALGGGWQTREGAGGCAPAGAHGIAPVAHRLERLVRSDKEGQPASARGTAPVAQRAVLLQPVAVSEEPEIAPRPNFMRMAQ